MICGNEIFFVKKMPFQKASTPIYLDLDLDLDTLRLYSLLSYVADQNSQSYCLGMLSDFVTKLGLKIDAHNSLLKLYLYRYISLSKSDKHINISLYYSKIDLLQFLKTNKQYIDLINNGKFNSLKEQYFVNQMICEVNIMMQNDTFKIVKPLSRDNTFAENETPKTNNDSQAIKSFLMDDTPEALKSLSRDNTFGVNETPKTNNASQAIKPFLMDDTPAALKPLSRDNSFNDIQNLNIPSQPISKKTLGGSTSFKNQIHSSNVVSKTDLTTKFDLKKQFIGKTEDNNKYQQDIICNKINKLGCFDQKLINFSIDTNFEGFYNGSTHTGTLRDDINQTSAVQNNKNKKTTTTTTLYSPNTAIDAHAASTVIASASRNVNTDLNSNSVVIQHTDNSDTPDANKVVVVVDQNNSQKTQNLKEVEVVGEIEPNTSLPSLPLPLDCKKYDREALLWSCLPTGYQGFIYNNVIKSRLNLGQAQRVINVIAHKVKTNAEINSLPAFLAKLIQSAKDDALFDPVCNVKPNNSNKTDGTNLQHIPPNLKSILRHHSITYMELIRIGLEDDAREYLTEHGLGIDGKRIYFTDEFLSNQAIRPFKS